MPDKKIDIYCICGHLNWIHNAGTDKWCFGKVGEERCECLNFKMDNLTTIEELAKVKGLV